MPLAPSTALAALAPLRMTVALAALAPLRMTVALAALAPLRMTAALGMTIALAVLLLGLTPHSPVFIDASQPVAVDAGEEFFIALQSNPSTGYSWSQTTADGKIVAYEGNVEQQAWKPMPGAPGQQIFIYHANRSGSTTIAFKYARPWEKNDPPAQTATFHVTVR